MMATSSSEVTFLLLRLSFCPHRLPLFQERRHALAEIRRFPRLHAGIYRGHHGRIKPGLRLRHQQLSGDARRLRAIVGKALRQCLSPTLQVLVWDEFIDETQLHRLFRINDPARQEQVAAALLTDLQRQKCRNYGRYKSDASLWKSELRIGRGQGEIAN